MAEPHFQHRRLLIIQYLLIYSGYVRTQDEIRDLNLMGFLPMTGKLFTGGGACLPSIKIALDIANNREDMLKGYKLNFLYKDDQCHPGVAADAMYEMLYTQPPKVMINGPGCSVAAEATARSSYMWNLTHMSSGGASPLLSDRRNYPRYFRTIAPDTRFNAARLALFRHFNWKKVATISVALDYFFAVTDDFLKLVEGTEIEILSQEIYNVDPTPRVRNLKAQDARIIMAGAYESQGRHILCAAYRVGLYGPKIVWIFPDWYQDYWWRKQPETVMCTTEQMDIASEGHLLTGFTYYNRDVYERSSAGINVMEFWELYRAHDLYRTDMVANEHICGICFDSGWAMALALNCSDTYLKQIGHSKSLADFNYTDGDIGDVIAECTQNLSFVGLSGRLDLTESDPIKAVTITQVKGLSKTLVGMYDLCDNAGSNKSAWCFEWLNGGITWKDGYVPRDSTQVTVLENTIPAYLYLLFSCIASAGILLSLGLFVFNVYHRHNVVVKLSSPNINNILLLGCTITYSVVFMYSYTSETAALCTLRTFAFTIGFSMAFGALFSKTWRVYRIFANKKLQRLKIQDKQLIGIVGLLLAVLCSILVVWTIVDPLTLEIYFLDSEVYFIGNDAEVRPYIHECVSQYQNYFRWVLYSIKGLLLIFGAFLSFETRKVTIPALNDSRLIGLCIYNVFVLAAIGLTLSLTLRTQVAMLYAINCGFTIFGTTATQLIIFLPKILAVYYPHRVDPGTSGSGSRITKMVSGTQKAPSRDTAAGSNQETMATIYKAGSSTDSKKGSTK